MTPASGDVIDDALNALEARATRIAQAAASSALREALPSIQAELRNPAFAGALGTAAVQTAFAPQNRAVLNELATSAGKGATSNLALYSGLSFAAGIVAAVIGARLLAKP